MPTDVDVGRLLANVRRRIVRLVRRYGIDLAGEDDATDPLALDSPALAQARGASVLGRVATGPRAGHRVLRLGADPNAAVVTTGGPRQAHSAGFDLHANVAVRAGERKRLEHLCRYVLRPPLAQEALELTSDGKVLLHLRRPWRDGTRAICFEPTELLERLAAMVPRPRANLLIYHGAFAPRGCRRAAAALEAASEQCSRVEERRSAEAGAATDQKWDRAGAWPGSTDCRAGWWRPRRGSAAAANTGTLRASPALCVGGPTAADLRDRHSCVSRLRRAATLAGDH